MTTKLARTHLSDPVPWGVFYTVIGLVITVFFGWLSSINAKVERVDSSQTVVLTQLSEIQANIKNLDVRITELRDDIRNQK